MHSDFKQADEVHSDFKQVDKVHSDFKQVDKVHSDIKQVDLVIAVFVPSEFGIYGQWKTLQRGVFP